MMELDKKSKKAVIVLKSLDKIIEKAARRAFYLLGKDLVKTARDGIIRGQHSGEKYKGLRRQSSAPGEYPASQSGELQRSIDFRVEGHDTLEFGSTVQHGAYLQEGTSKMEARPFLTLALEDNMENAQKLFENVLISEIEKK